MDHRNWLHIRLSLRIGRRRWLLTLPPQMSSLRYFVITLLLLMGYIVGAVPTERVLARTGLWTTFEPVFLVVYFPLIWLSENSSLIAAFFEMEDRLLRWLMGN